MKRVTLLISLFLFAFGLRAEESAPFPTLEELVPAGPVKVEVMGIVRSKRIQDLSARLQKAAAANQAWFTEYGKEHKDEVALPYHENFGITKEEYQELLNDAQTSKMQKTGDSELLVKSVEGGVELSFDKAENLLQPITIIFDEKSATTPLTFMAAPRHTTVTDMSGTLGPNQAYLWRSTNGTTKSGNFTSVDLTLGQFTESGKRFLRYKVLKVKGQKQEVDFETTLYYDGAAGAKKVEPAKPKALSPADKLKPLFAQGAADNPETTQEISKLWLARPEPAFAEPAKSEPAKPEPAKEKAAKPEIAKVEAAKPEVVKEETAKVEPKKEKAAEPEPEPVKEKAAKPELAKEETAKPEPAKKEDQEEEARKAEAAREETAKEEARKAEIARKEAAREEARQAGLTKKEAAKEEAAQRAAEKAEARKAELARKEAEKAEKAEARKAEAARKEAAKAEAAKAEAARAEAARVAAEAAKEAERKKHLPSGPQPVAPKVQEASSGTAVKLPAPSPAPAKEE